jgi:hypothetical protein
MSDRDELSEEISRTVPLPRIIAAAVAMMRQDPVVQKLVAEQLGGAPESEWHIETEAVAKYIASLDVRGLERLRELALSLEGGMEH